MSQLTYKQRDELEAEIEELKAKLETCETCKFNGSDNGESWQEGYNQAKRELEAKLAEYEDNILCEFEDIEMQDIFRSELMGGDSVLEVYAKNRVIVIEVK